VAALGRPIKRPFSPIAAIDVELPLTRAALEELGVRGLQSGCGDAVRRHWLNTDNRPLHDGSDFRTERGRVYRAEEDRFFLQHDVPEPFPIADESLDWCYSEHFLEHLTLDDGIGWLAEMRRVLARGGFVRVSTPDLSKYATGYVDAGGPFFAQHGDRIAHWFPDPSAVERPAFMVNQTFFSWGHQWMYDLEELRHAAVMAGFSADAVTERRFREGREPDVAKLDLPERENESLYVEIEKT
jgi:predicted SAM-dependent methyltransferase